MYKNPLFTLAFVLFFIAGCGSLPQRSVPIRLYNGVNDHYKILREYKMFISVEVPVDTDKDGDPEMRIRISADPQNDDRKSDYVIVFSDKERKDRLLAVMHEDRLLRRFMPDGNGWKKCDPIKVCKKEYDALIADVSARNEKHFSQLTREALGVLKNILARGTQQQKNLF